MRAVRRNQGEVWRQALAGETPGSVRPWAENQRPEACRKNRPLEGSKNSTLAVFLTTCSPVPGTGANCGAPAVTMISAGLVLTKNTCTTAGPLAGRRNGLSGRGEIRVPGNAENAGGRL